MTPARRDSSGYRQVIGGGRLAVGAVVFLVAICWDVLNRMKEWRSGSTSGAFEVGDWLHSELI